MTAFVDDDDWLTEVSVKNNSIENADVTNSFTHYTNLKTDNLLEYNHIYHYRQEIECDEWNDANLTVSFEIINWLLQNKPETSNTDFIKTIPTILNCPEITMDNLQSQITNASTMNDTLQKFPTITSENNPQGIHLFRGINCNFINNTPLKSNKQITFNNFLSTSLFLDTAIRFAGSPACIMSIHVTPGNVLPFITDNLLKVKLYNPEVTSEAEVLLPIGATLQFIKKFTMEKNSRELTIYCFKLVSYRMETRTFLDYYKKIIPDRWIDIEGVRINNDSLPDAKKQRTRGGEKMQKRKKTYTA